MRMMFLPYTPRTDADSRGYDRWLQETDNPFFNSRPGVHHYSNWKVADGLAPFTHFDFLLLDNDVAPAAIWADAPLAAFAQRWVEQWGAYPDADDPALNYHCYVASGGSGEPGEFGPVVHLDPASTQGEVWTFGEAIVGVPPWRGFARSFEEPCASGSITGHLIAAPRG